MKLNAATVIAILLGVVLVASVLGYISLPTFNPQSGTIIPGQNNPTPTPFVPNTQNGQVSVTKQLKIVGVDELAGGSLDGTTNAITVIDSDGKTTLETGTLSSGSVTTANSYTSGRSLWIKYYYDTTIDAYMYWQITVPTMGAQDAESLTTNSITLKTREAGAYTDNAMTSSGITLADSAVVNTTSSTNDTGTITYSFYTTSDNTGYPTFHDPVYNLDMKIVFWAELSGTGYSSFSLTGFDGGFEKGTTMYYYKVVDPNSVAKYKVANDYVYPGYGAVSFSYNCVGFANSTAAGVTLQLNLKVYSNPSYMQQYGDYGPYDFTAAEQTITFYDI